MFFIIVFIMCFGFGFVGFWLGFGFVGACWFGFVGVGFFGFGFLVGFLVWGLV